MISVNLQRSPSVLTHIKASAKQAPYRRVETFERTIHMTDTAVAKALELAPVIERVHGEHHPELTRVREITELLAASGPETNVQELFGELRGVTNDYAIPSDVCVTFRATYEALEKAESRLLPRG